MQTRTLGPFRVSAIGLGAMALSFNAERLYPDEAQAIATIHAALDAGITFIDTSDTYAPSWDTMGHNEALILRGAVEKSLRALGTDVIDLYQWQRPDRWKVYGDVIGAFQQLRQEGKIKAIGICNAEIHEIEIARELLGDDGLASVQNEFSPRFRSSKIELDYCTEHGISFLSWSPLGGVVDGGRQIGRKFPIFAEVAHDHGVSPQQVVLAWELASSDRIIPLPGARRPESIIDSAKAVDLELSVDELVRCSGIGID